MIHLLHSAPQIRLIFEEFKTADVIIDIWGIIFADQIKGTFLDRAYEGCHLFIGKSFNKPVIKYTADCGPFKLKWNRFFAKFYFNRIDLIFSRSETSKRNLIEIGIKTPIFVYPDTAFLLPLFPVLDIYDYFQKYKLNRPLLGFPVSYTIEQYESTPNQYSTIMAQICDYLVLNI